MMTKLFKPIAFRFNPVIFFITSITLIFITSCSNHYTSLDSVENSPRITVIEWTRVYGIDLDRAAELTTIDFRDGKPKQVWAKEIWDTMEPIKYKHLGGTVIKEVIEREEALVILQSEIDTIAGGAKQKEFYRMKRIDGKWLIDDIKVKEEESKEPTQEL